jgi:hypothetical protein
MLLHPACSPRQCQGEKTLKNSERRVNKKFIQIRCRVNAEKPCKQRLNNNTTKTTSTSHSNHALIAFDSRILVTLIAGAAEFVASLKIPFSSEIMRN